MYKTAISDGFDPKKYNRKQSEQSDSKFELRGDVSGYFYNENRQQK